MTLSISINSIKIQYEKNPNICPVCRHAVAPKVIGSSISGDFASIDTFIDIAFQCVQGQCLRMFIGRYNRRESQTTIGKPIGSFRLIEVVPLTYKAPHIAQEIVDISPSFETIFKQAAAAESYNLNEIAGVGYRKALEFLIKDYCIQKNPASGDSIKTTFLGKVIKDNVDDPNVKMCAERATWLGNDETHYVRKWDGKDIKDLKILIELTSNWMVNNILTEKYMNEMDR